MYFIYLYKKQPIISIYNFENTGFSLVSIAVMALRTSSLCNIAWFHNFCKISIFKISVKNNN